MKKSILSIIGRKSKGLPKVIENSQYSRIIKEPIWKRMDEELQMEIEDIMLQMKNLGQL